MKRKINNGLRFCVLFTIGMLASCGNTKQKDLGKDRVHSLVNHLKMGYDTTSYSVVLYDSLVTLFNSQQVSKGCLLFLGNSITEGGDWTKLLPNQNVVNQGIGGDLTFGVIRRLNEVIRHQPSQVFLMIGINDLSRNVPATLVIQNIFTIIETLKHEIPETQVVIQSLLPINDDVEVFPSGYDHNERILTINSKLAENNRNLDYYYVNLHGSFTNQSGKLIQDYTYDGLHLNSKGYTLWVEILKAEGLLNETMIK